MRVLLLVFPAPYPHVELRDEVGQGIENYPKRLYITAIDF